MSERAMQKAVTMAHRARRQAAGLQFAVELGELRRPQLLDHNSAEVRLDLIFDDLAIALEGFGRAIERGVIPIPPLEEFRNGDFRRINREAGLVLRDQAGELELGIALVALERDVAGFALSCCRIKTNVEFDLERTCTAERWSD